MPGDDLKYFFHVPWVSGPEGSNHPFWLDTKYGRTVFVFADQHEAFQQFFQVSAEDLKPGFKLEKCLVIADDPSHVKGELAKSMPPGPFTLALEGTRDFDTMIQKLSDGTIWA